MRRLCSVLFLMTIPLAAHAALLGTVSVLFDFSVSPPVPFQANASMTFDHVAVLFDDVVLTAASTGLVLTATSSDADYYPVVGMLANGALDVLYFGALMAPGLSQQSWPEKNWFSLSTNDFLGTNITSITLTVDDISFKTEDPWTNIHLAYTVRLYGEASLAVEAKTWGGIKALYR